MSNGQVPGQSGEAAEGTAPDDNVGTRPEGWQEFLELAQDWVVPEFLRPEDGSDTAGSSLPELANNPDQ